MPRHEDSQPERVQTSEYSDGTSLPSRLRVSRGFAAGPFTLHVGGELGAVASRLRDDAREFRLFVASHLTALDTARVLASSDSHAFRDFQPFVVGFGASGESESDSDSSRGTSGESRSESDSCATSPANRGKT